VLIDWFTVAAQVLNFLILMWLMKRFLYHPVLDAIDAREKRIAGELAQADATKAAAQQERDNFRSKSEHLEQQRTELLRQATDAANAERQRLLEEARKAAADLSAQRQESERTEARRLRQALTHRTQQEVFGIARKALADLADASLEAQMVAVLVRRLQTLNAADKAALGAVFTGSPATLSVRSSFELPPAERAALGTAIGESLGVAPTLHFETAPELIGGIEIATDGHKLAWSITEYLASLLAGVDELLEGKAQPPAPDDAEASAAPKPRIHAS
jgi:F-type H+-transporting ATPase subunit b